VGQIADKCHPQKMAKNQPPLSFHVPPAHRAGQNKPDGQFAINCTGEPREPLKLNLENRYTRNRLEGALQRIVEDRNIGASSNA
jgi:hypothetical protein